jgi:hypothetical protein
MSSHQQHNPTIPLRGECEKAMLFPIIIFLMVLSPLFIPLAVTVVHQLGNVRDRFAMPAAPAVPAFA